MQKILELSSEAFFTGLATGANISNGIFYKAKGVTPYVNCFQESADIGLLQASAAPTNFTTSDVVLGMVSTVSADGATLFMNGDQGKFYQYRVGDSNNKTYLRSTASISAATGLSIFNNELLYAQSTQIGKRNLSTGVWTDNAYTGLQSYTNHQIHRMYDRAFVADKNYISKLSINSTGTTVLTTQVLDFSSDYFVQALNDDGKYLVAGITQNQGNNIYYGKTKLIFWDTNSDSWNKEHILPDPSINSISRDNISMIAHGGRGMYRFTFDSKPELIMPQTSSEAVKYGCPHASANFFSNIIWGANNEVFSYGSTLPGQSMSIFCPHTGMTGYPTVVFPNPYVGRLYVSTTDSKVYRFSSVSGGNTGVSAQTIVFDLKQKWTIKKINVLFGKALASGDSINIDVSNDVNATATDYGDISYAKFGAVTEQTISKTFITSQLSLIINFNGGNPKIKRVTIYGEPASN